MAMMASRILNRTSRQLYSAQAIISSEHNLSVRSFAKEASPVSTDGVGDKILKKIFFDVKKKFDIALGILKTEKITVDPEDPAAVSQYANVIKNIREKANLFTEAQRIEFTIKQKTEGIPDARTYLITLKEIRVKRGLKDDLGAEAMMFDALEKVETQLKKPLLRSDKKGMAVLMAEFEKVNQKLGISQQDLPKYENELELKIAKEQLQHMKKEAEEAMDTLLKKPEFQDEQMVETKTLDMRNFM
ncbi:Mitochondrial ATP synthase [Zostera marina]|uniref:Mitochondrial ATP synthase n=1 Tax=Zostera marina TaxID=29655 RepID=A0A0K9NX98_ZOSMR|nr:Mitochondrial ATP synthase [Zostera marina]